MATEVIKTIRASGGDYTTLSAWEAALPASLVTADEQHTAVCYNDWPSGLADPVVIAGSVVDATRFIKITVAEGHRHDGTGNHTGFYLKGNKGANSGFFQNTVSYTQVEWLDVEHTRNSNYARAIYSLAPYGSAKNCIGKVQNSTNNTIECISWASNSNTESTWPLVVNCVALNGYCGFRDGNDAARLRAKYYNCTAANCNTGFPGHATIPGTAINCVAHDCTTGFTTGWQAASGYNAASDTTATTLFSNSVSGIVDADFVDATGGDFHLASGSALIGVGTNLYSLFTDDIDGDIRPSSGAWDIGFDYYVASGGANTDTAAGGGSIAITGSAAAALRSHLGAASASSIAITGSAANGVYATVGAVTSSADSGSITLTGSPAVGLHDYLAIAGSGSIVLTGSAANAAKSLGASADSGSIVLTGSSAIAVRTWLASVEAGSVTITGASATGVKATPGTGTLDEATILAIAEAVWADPVAVAAHAKLDAIIARLTC